MTALTVESARAALVMEEAVDQEYLRKTQEIIEWVNTLYRGQQASLIAAREELSSAMAAQLGLVIGLEREFEGVPHFISGWRSVGKDRLLVFAHRRLKSGKPAATVGCFSFDFPEAADD